MRKRFVKLLLFKVDTQYRLLYGFSSETEQSSYPWKTFPADRKGQKLIAKAILSPSEADNFLISLTGTEPIMLCERVTLKSPQLYKREQLLYSDDEEQQAVPISEFCYLFEFWNREKLSLLSEIQNEFSADGRTRYEQTLELLEWAKCNCGIDFCIDGRRFGNYEVYYRTPENSSFEIDIHKDQGLRVTTIRKCKDFAEDIIVNCIGKYKDYVICNQTQVWPANKKEIYFEANEPLLARAERILKREIQDCQTASDIPRSIALYLNCVDALYGENAENHIFKDILDWNTFEDATEPELQNYDYHRSRNAFILAQRQIQILEGMLVKWPESEKAKAWLNAWACRLKQIPEKL